MRTGPFSQTSVIEQLNASFVPVYVVNEDYRENGPAPQEERAEMQRIYRESLKAGFSTGTVHVYVLSPDGKPFGTLHVADAAKTENLLKLMNRCVSTLQVKPGKPLVKPTPQSIAPKTDPGSLVLHLTARPLSGGGSWDGISENWIVYTPDEIEGWLPEQPLRPGDTWMPAPRLVERTLLHVYPVTENNDVTKNRIEAQSLTATVLSVKDGIVRARLDGSLRMEHWFYHKDDGKMVEASLLGFIEFDTKRPQIRTLRLVTEKATYGGGTFGVAVRSLR